VYVGRNSARRRLGPMALAAEDHGQPLDPKSTQPRKQTCSDRYKSFKREREQNLEALERAKADLELARKEQEALQESPRRKGALPGWLRE